MKKAVICVLLAAALLGACEPHVRGRLGDAADALVDRLRGGDAASDAALSFSEQLGSHDRTDMIDVTLYYRFGDTAVLGAQRAQLDIRREETVAMRIVQLLVQGPDIAHDRLGGLFPQGTRVISVTGEETTAFVTLSSAFLGRPDGAPAGWEDMPEWQEEAALRRRLAVQSIVLSLTEDARYQRVQLYVADTDDDVPERVPMAWFDTTVTDPTLLLAASPRDEQAMLTPERAMDMILDAWQKGDWTALYTLLSPQGNDALPSGSEFEARMREMDVSLLDYSTTNGTVSFDGQTATMVLDAQLRSDAGGDAQIVRESVPLVRWQDNWTITEDTLRTLMIRD